MQVTVPQFPLNKMCPNVSVCVCVREGGRQTNSPLPRALLLLMHNDFLQKSISRCTLLAAGLALLQLTSTALADVSHLSPPAPLEYSITPSAQVAYYQYPAPRVVQHQRQQLQPQHHQQVARQFAAPALEHAAFTQALTSSGYVFGANPPSSAALTAAAAAPQPAASTGRAIATQASDSNSLNLKLPVPLGAMPLNVAHLPLQAGAPYALVPRTTGLTSYGTAHLQR